MNGYIKELKPPKVSTKSEFDASRVDGQDQKRQFSWDESPTLKDDPFFEIESDVLINDGVIRR